jgi:membrane protein YdbS with pleckstrin-like domain
MASSVAAIGIAVGMLGAAAASIVTALRGLQPWWMVFVAIAVAVLAVSMPSVILTYLKLRRRDIGAILNACGWAVNRRMRFSMRLAKQFTRCA